MCKCERCGLRWHPSGLRQTERACRVLYAVCVCVLCAVRAFNTAAPSRARSRGSRFFARRARARDFLSASTGCHQSPALRFLNDIVFASGTRRVLLSSIPPLAHERALGPLCAATEVRTEDTRQPTGATLPGPRLPRPSAAHLPCHTHVRTRTRSAHDSALAAISASSAC